MSERKINPADVTVSTDQYMVTGIRPKAKLNGEPVGDCSWCTFPVFEDEDWVAGNRGEGVMHKDCLDRVTDLGPLKWRPRDDRAHDESA